jgi:2-isopropylmalate synthase
MLRGLLLFQRRFKMNKMPFEKYRPFHTDDLPDRRWPSHRTTQAPRWCSVDLRDGNQAIIVPMGVEEKKEMFGLLVKTGFREIEVGFPSASQTEYDFVRMLIEKDLIPDNVTVQALTQARGHLIRKTFEAFRGAASAIVHLYNSTSEQQRRIVFRMDRRGILDLAVRGAEMLRKEAEHSGGAKIIYQYSPESFTGTENDFALEVCEAVMDIWEPTEENRTIINLPATVEMSSPNVYADRIEWFCRNIKNRERIIVSVHAHNDRGTAVAATELALLAGADRVEGTLFGNGERTGNVDIVTLAMNMFSQGIDPCLDFSDIDSVAEVCSRCTGLPVHPRHPYAGELVYTAFSGSHQDAISKGMKARGSADSLWEVPYLPIDPADVGRTYESIIRINSQSGKGGVAYILEKEHGMYLPKKMHAEFGRFVQAISDATGKEVSSGMIWNAFRDEYLEGSGPYGIGRCDVDSRSEGGASITAAISINGQAYEITGKGNGPIDAFCNALREHCGISMKLVSYHEHALQQGSDATAVAYVEVEDNNGASHWGAATDPNIERASFMAILSALNRLEEK